MHRACLALRVRFAVLAWKAQKTEIDSCSAVDFFYRHLLGIDRLWKKCIFLLLFTPFSYKFQTWLWERASIRWLLRMRALQRQLQGFTDMIQRRFSWSSYDLRPNIIPASFFWVKCVRFSPCHKQDFSKRPGDFHRFPTNYRRLPNVAES